MLVSFSKPLQGFSQFGVTDLGRSSGQAGTCLFGESGTLRFSALALNAHLAGNDLQFDRGEAGKFTGLAQLPDQRAFLLADSTDPDGRVDLQYQAIVMKLPD